MHLRCLVLCLLTACGAAAGGTSQPAPVANQPDTITRDLETIIGGMFSPEHLGPDVYAAIKARAQGDAVHYLAALRDLVGDHPDPLWLSNTYVPSAIALLGERAPTEAGALARRFLPIYRRAVEQAPPDHDPDQFEKTRLSQRVGELVNLAPR